MSLGCGSKVLVARRKLQEAGVDTGGLTSKQKVLHARWKLKEARKLDQAHELQQQQLEASLIESLERKRDLLVQQVHGKLLSRMPTRSHGVGANAFVPPQQANRSRSGTHQELLESEAGSTTRADNPEELLLSPGPLSVEWDRGQALRRSEGPSALQLSEGDGRREEEEEEQDARGRAERQGRWRLQAMLARVPLRRFAERLCGFLPDGNRL